MSTQKKKRVRKSAGHKTAARKSTSRKHGSVTAARRRKVGTARPKRAARTLDRALVPAFTVLKLGSTGAEVMRLQRRLAELGFQPGAIDGDFGHGTEAAVLAFQWSEGLLPDGVAGPRTLAALHLAEDDALPSALPNLTVQVVAAMCPGAPLGNIKAYLPALCTALSEQGLVDKPMLLMAVATIVAETGRFLPLDEFRSRFNTSPNAVSPYFDLYDRRTDLGNRGPNDGSAFKGRGFVQLTGRANYEQYSRTLGLTDALVRKPELANDPLIAARILARFLKDREMKIKGALLDRNFAQARKYVNGGSHGLTEFTNAYLTGERLIA